MLLAALAALQLLTPSDPTPERLDRRITPEVTVVQAAGPAVVYIRTNIRTRQQSLWFGPRERVQQGSGSGVVIYDDGYIVTNNHVIQGAQEIQVFFSDDIENGKGHSAQVISTRPSDDLALLKIDGEGPFPVVPLGTSRDLMIGERVLAIGNPYGQTHTVSAGIISGLHRELRTNNIRFRDLIQTDASINPGNSGGPLLNINGELIGINTVMNSVAENIGFAIPVDHVRDVLREHLLSPDKAKAWLGYETDLETLTVAAVATEGPASRAGLASGDRIVAFGGKAIESEDDYRLAYVSIEPGQSVPVGVERNGKRMDVELTGWPRVDGFLFDRVGALFDPVLLGARPPFATVQVRELRPGGPAERLGLEAGDFLRYVRPARSSSHQIRSPEDLAILVSRMRPQDLLDIEIWRDEDDNGVLERTGDASEVFSGQLQIE